jgi:hypothetical protein
LAPFGDDTSTTRETVFAKIRARVDGTHIVRAARLVGCKSTQSQWLRPQLLILRGI